jgi:hypothetical protein
MHSTQTALKTHSRLGGFLYFSLKFKIGRKMSIKKFHAAPIDESRSHKWTLVSTNQLINEPQIKQVEPARGT